MLPGSGEFKGAKGSSKVHTLGGGRYFSKQTDVDSVGSPHAEEATSKAFDVMSVPHIPTHVVAHPENPTQLYNVSPLHSNVMGIMHVRPGEHAARIIGNPKQTADTLFAEWVANVSDRHGNNYVTTSQHPNPVSIDHGQAWHPGTAVWPVENIEGRKFPQTWGMRQMKNVGEATNPFSSDLLSLHRELKGKWPLQVSPHVIQNALMHQSDLERLAYEGTKGLPEEERSLAVVGLIKRMQAIRDKLKETGGNFFVHNLHDLYNDIVHHGKYENHLR